MVLSLSIFVTAQDTCTGGIIDFFHKGNVTIHQGATTTRANDSCFDSSINIPDGTTQKELLKLYWNDTSVIQEKPTGAYLFETSCSSNTFNGTTEYDVGETYKCPNGCSNGACIKINPKNKPIELPSEITDKGKNLLCQGCVLKDNCYPIGYRMKNVYCGNQEFSNQKEAGASCNNNFECSSNLCINDSCIKGSLWQKIINWFKNLFG